MRFVYSVLGISLYSLGVIFGLFAFIGAIAQSNRNESVLVSLLLAPFVIAFLFLGYQCNKRAKELKSLEISKQKIALTPEFTAKPNPKDSTLQSLNDVTPDRQSSNDSTLQSLLDLHLGLLRKNAAKRINADNFTAVKAEIGKAWERVESIGVRVPLSHKKEVERELLKAFEDAVRAQVIREEQNRIKDRIRQEEKVAAEARKVAEQAERDSRKIQEALNEALKHSQDQRSEEIEALRKQLAEAESRGQRAKSMAQQTKRGFVYIISNIGSFGEGVFKIGMTRRLEPQDRVDELSDASVPFSFDVHALLESENAPTLEHELHMAFNHQRVNKINLKKEFFRANLGDIISAAEKQVGTTIAYKLEPEAAEFLASRGVKNEDLDIAATISPEIVEE